MTALMNYLYTDRIPTERGVTVKLIPLSDRYALPRLKKLCVDATTNIPIIVPESSFQKWADATAPTLRDHPQGHAGGPGQSKVL